jgi:hypothetical protein
VAYKSAKMVSKMLRIFLIIGFLTSATLWGLTLALGIRMSHELNAKLPEGKKRGLFSGWGPDVSRLHHQLVPHSRLGSATKASQFAASLLALCSSVTWLLTL